MKFFIGLLLGIIIAGGTAYYLNKAPNPFVNKGFDNSSTNASANQATSGSATPLILAPGTKMQAATAQAASGVSDQKASASTPNYDFYDVLQGKKDINPKPTTASQPQANSSGFLVQVGAFSNQDLANNMKAKMALLGFTTKIKSQEENGRIINKVLMGPFTDINQAQNVVDQLKQQDIGATIITLN